MKTLNTKYLALILATILAFAACSKNNSIPDTKPKTGNWCGTIDEYSITAEEMTDLIKKAVPDVSFLADIISLYLCDIDVAKIKYTTTDPEGKIIEASGFITYPSHIKKYNHILSIQHGTMDVNSGPTDQVFPIETIPVFNYDMVVMADLLGYGVSKTEDMKNTYMHAKTTGTACADMIQASRQYLATKKDLTFTSDSIRLIGYSQGGQATIATLFEMERRGLGNQISLVWAGGGPYDMTAFLKESIKNPTSRKNGYIVHSIEGVMTGDRLVLDKHNIYAPEMFKNGELIFSKHVLSEWPDIIGADIHKILHENFFKADYGGNTTDVYKLMQHMDANSVVKISDKLSKNVHIRFYHNKKDTYVPYCCSESAHSTWENNSELINLTLGKDHPANGAEFLFEYMGEDFEGLKNLIVPLINLIIR